MVDIKVEEGIVQVRDSGSVIYDMTGLAIAVLNCVEKDSDDRTAYATLLSELSLNMVLP
jgi:hypothetical protein